MVLEAAQVGFVRREARPEVWYHIIVWLFLICSHSCFSCPVDNHNRHRRNDATTSHASPRDAPLTNSAGSTAL